MDQRSDCDGHNAKLEMDTEWSSGVDYIQRATRRAHLMRHRWIDIWATTQKQTSWRMVSRAANHERIRRTW
eukprot:9473949-Pyramimonas_sp.AAC.1